MFTNKTPIKIILIECKKNNEVILMINVFLLTQFWLHPLFALFLLSLLLPLLLQQSSHVRQPFPVIYFSFFHLIPRFCCWTLWGVACAILIDQRHRVKWNTFSSSHVWRPTLLSAPAHTWTDTSCRSVGDAPPLCKSIIITIFKIKDLTTISFFC